MHGTGAIFKIFYSKLKNKDMSEGSKFNFKTILWIVVGLLLLAGCFYILSTAAEIPSQGDGVH
jgi:uncharacterized lipoprotein YajG